MQGLSEIPQITPQTEIKVKNILKDVKKAHEYLQTIDPVFANSISANDKYRLEKALLIYEASSIAPSKWFEKHPPQPIIKDIPIYNIDVEREVLRQRINLRTNTMVELGLIDEICYLEQKYTREPNSMGAIGIVEVLEYLDNKISKEQMIQSISTHTAQLAKRQQTYNRTQFQNTINAPLEKLYEFIMKDF